MPSITNQITKRIRGKGRGWVFTPKDFIDFGTRASVDMALMRLTKVGAIRRVARGLYDYPKLHDKLGMLSPNPDSVVLAISAQTGDKISATGATAANQLGFSTQVPARVAYATTGPSRVKKIANRTLVLKHTRAPMIDKGSDRANAAVQLMAHLGKSNVNADVVRRVADQLDDRDIKILVGSRTQMSGWMGDVILKIEAAKHG